MKFISIGLWFYFVVYCILFPFELSGYQLNHESISGVPFISTYTEEDFGEYSDNWGIHENLCIGQDSDGIMYFGNSEGVLVYDGTRWDLISLPEDFGVSSLAIDAQDRIYIAGVDRFGYLNKDRRYQFICLSDSLPGNSRKTLGVNNIICRPEGVYFQTKHSIIHWDGKIIEELFRSTANSFSKGFVVKDRYIFQDYKKGLMVLSGNDLESVNAGDFFSDIRVSAILPLSDGYLICTYRHGLFILDQGVVREFKFEIPDYLVGQHIESALLLDNGEIALGTSDKGILVLDENGAFRLRIDDDKVIPSLFITDIFQDVSGLLWISTAFGLAKIEYPGPYTVFNSINGLDGVVYDVQGFDQSIYVATNEGLFVNNNPRGGQTFAKIGDFEGKVWHLLKTNGALLIGTGSGLYRISNEQRELHKLLDVPCMYLTQSRLDPDRFYISSDAGVSRFKVTGGQFKLEAEFPDVTGFTRTVHEQKDGNLWIESNYGYLWRIEFRTGRDYIVRQYTHEDGLPGKFGRIYLIDDHPWFVCFSDKTTYEYVDTSDRFREDRTLNQKLGFPGQGVFINYQDTKGNVLFTVRGHGHEPERMLAEKTGSDAYRFQYLEEERIEHLIKEYAVFVDDDREMVWYTGAKGLMVHNLRENHPKRKILPANITRVYYQTDSLLRANEGITKLPYNDNYFRFQYSSPNFQAEDLNTYQYFLSGFDRGWSSWSSETQRDFTLLPPGRYVFRVRSKDVRGDISSEDSFAFHILLPWYRSFWAIISYVILVGFLILLLIKWRTWRLQRAKNQLEEEIRLRTEEVREKNERLMEQTERLREQAEKLKDLDLQKSRLYSNISHEFRTPLTLIKAPIARVISSGIDKIDLKHARMIYRNSNRLLHLVNQLMDLSKLDARSMKMNATEGDINRFLRRIASSFSSMAALKNIDYEIDLPQSSFWCSFDRDKLEKIINNLLSNAFKYTPIGGEVRVFVTMVNENISISVIDSGIGIKVEEHQKIFNRFYQVDNSNTKEYPGTGIGLALTKELVDLFKGKIKVEPRPEGGTIFQVIFPVVEIRNLALSPFQDLPALDNYEHIEDISVATGIAKGPKILIVEDNPDMLAFISEVLAGKYSILFAQNGQEGLEKAREEGPDLIITDLMMPKLDGLEVCANLRGNELTSHIPIILLTAKDGRSNRIKGFQTGADDYLTKPFDHLELQARVGNLIEQRKRLRNLFKQKFSIDPEDVDIPSLDRQFLRKLVEVVEDRYSDPLFGATEMQQMLALSKTNLHRKLTALTGLSAGQFIREYRLKKAASILGQNGANVTQTALSVGFSSLSYFAKCFRKRYGVNPSEYTVTT